MHGSSPSGRMGLIFLSALWPSGHGAAHATRQRSLSGARCRPASRMDGAPSRRTRSSSAVCQCFFSGLSILIRRSVNSDSSQPSCRCVRFGFFSHEMTVGPHVIRGMSADPKNQCSSGECRFMRYRSDRATQWGPITRQRPVRHSPPLRPAVALV